MTGVPYLHLRRVKQMRYQFSTKEIGFNTNSAQVEAYRRALEIRQFVLEREGVSPRLANRRKETFC